MALFPAVKHDTYFSSFNWPIGTRSLERHLFDKNWAFLGPSLDPQSIVHSVLLLIAPCKYHSSRVSISVWVGSFGRKPPWHALTSIVVFTPPAEAFFIFSSF